MNVNEAKLDSHLKHAGLSTSSLGKRSVIILEWTTIPSYETLSRARLNPGRLLSITSSATQ